VVSAGAMHFDEPYEPDSGQRPCTTGPAGCEYFWEPLPLSSTITPHSGADPQSMNEAEACRVEFRKCSGVLLLNSGAAETVARRRKAATRNMLLV